MSNMIKRMYMMSFLLCALVLALSLLPMPSHAQQAIPPVYSVSIIDWRTSANGQNIEIEFKVVNSGGAATQQVRTDIVVVEGPDQTRVLASADLRPLGALAPENEQSMIMTAPLASFEPGSRQVFRVQFVTPPGMAGRFNNSTTVSIDVPASGDSTTGTGGSGPVTTPGSDTTDTGTSTPEIQDVTPANPFTVPLLNLTIDLNNREHVLLAVGFIATLLLVILLITRLILSMFSKRPAFGSWHPPYATVPHLDPNSTSGIRQAWQQHANNNVIDIPATPGATHAVKQLIGTDGEYLSGWQVLALRLNLYDQYGRVARTQTLASSKDIREINAILRRRDRMKPERIVKRLRPIAKRLSRGFYKRVSPRSAMLPVALDVRLTGKHGEVNIVFELYQFHQGMWQLLDQWSPEMMIVSKRLYDSYTYTIFGLSGGETMREYRQRLPVDLEHRLIELVGALPQQLQNAKTSQKAPSAPTGTVDTVSDVEDEEESGNVQKIEQVREPSRRGLFGRRTARGTARNEITNGSVKPARPENVAPGTPSGEQPAAHNGEEIYLEADDHDLNTVKSSSYTDNGDKSE